MPVGASVRRFRATKRRSPNMTPVNRSRRNFLAGLGLAAGAVTATAACLQAPPNTTRTGSALPKEPAVKPAAAVVAPAPAPANAMAGMDHAQMAAPAAKPATAPAASANPAVSAMAKADEMDKHHEAGIKAFPAKTA